MPVLVISGNPLEVIPSERVDFLAKPFSADDLMKDIAVLVEESRKAASA